MPTLNKWGERAVNIVAIGAMLTLFVNIADSRYAIADDLKKLKADLHARDVLEVEDKIAILEDDLYIIQQHDILTNREKAKISRLENRKQKYLRRLQSIKSLDNR